MSAALFVTNKGSVEELKRV